VGHPMVIEPSASTPGRDAKGGFAVDTSRSFTLAVLLLLPRVVEPIRSSSGINAVARDGHGFMCGRARVHQVGYGGVAGVVEDEPTACPPDGVAGRLALAPPCGCS